jgi:protein-tyrosine-phosphatase
VVELVETPEPAPVVVPVETPEPTDDAGLDILVPPEEQQASGFEPRLRPAAPTSSGEPPLRVLYVCTANICRSPFMELVSRQLAGPDASIAFASAGTHGFRSSPMDPDMAATLPRRGVTTSGSFRSRPFTTEMLLHADLVLTAEAAHRRFILDDHPGAFRKVFSLGQFAEAVRVLDGNPAGRDLLGAVAARRGPAEPALDVPDPYGRGAEVAETCAAALEELLRVVVPALTGSRKITA